MTMTVFQMKAHLSQNDYYNQHQSLVHRQKKIRTAKELLQSRPSLNNFVPICKQYQISDSIEATLETNALNEPFQAVERLIMIATNVSVRFQVLKEQMGRLGQESL